LLYFFRSEEKRALERGKIVGPSPIFNVKEKKWRRGGYKQTACIFFIFTRGAEEQEEEEEKKIDVYIFPKISSASLCFHFFHHSLPYKWSWTGFRGCEYTREMRTCAGFVISYVSMNRLKWTFATLSKCIFVLISYRKFTL